MMANQRAPLSGVVLQDLSHTQTGAPHHGRRGARLMPIMGRQRVQQTLHLVGRPIVRYLHSGRLQDELCQNGQRQQFRPERRRRQEGQKWQSCVQTLPLPCRNKRFRRSSRLC